MDNWTTSATNSFTDGGTDALVEQQRSSKSNAPVGENGVGSVVAAVSTTSASAEDVGTQVNTTSAQDGDVTACPGTLSTTNYAAAPNLKKLENPQAAELEGSGSPVLQPPRTAEESASLVSTTPASSPSNEVDVIDSALLSALSDPRERKGLLRLEQTLVDFMKERTTGYIEVGGPNNSVVIGGQSGGSLGRLAAAGLPSDQDGGAQNLPQSPYQQTESAQYSGRGGRQTSFQRLCLHRLADRFNIVRENPSSATGDGAHEGGSSAGSSHGNGSVTYPPGLIRLVKVKDSRIPKKLLIDLDVSNYANARASDNSRRYNQSNSMGDRVDGADAAALRGITENLSSASLGDGNSSKSAGSGAGTRQPPKKMMIMKRSSSNLGSTGSLKGKDGKSGRGRRDGRGRSGGLKGKNLSDREKAYEEARARIFNESQSGGVGEGSDDPSSHQQQSHPQEQQTQESAERRTSTGSIYDIGGGGSSVAGSSNNPTPSSSPPPPPITSSPPPSDAGTSTNSADDSLDGNSPNIDSSIGKSDRVSTSGAVAGLSSSSSASSLPAAATTGGAVSKVTWRNRRQEENDPDFKRRGTVRVPVNVSAAGNSLGAVPGAVVPGGVVVATATGPIHLSPAASTAQYVTTGYTAGPGGPVQPYVAMVAAPPTKQHYYPQQQSPCSSDGGSPVSRQQQQQQQQQAYQQAVWQQQQQQQQQQQRPHQRNRSQSSTAQGQQQQQHPQLQQQHRDSNYSSSQVRQQKWSAGGMYHASSQHNGSSRAMTSGGKNPAQAANVYNMDEFPALG